MRHINRVISALALGIATSTAQAIPFTFEGRSLGMGGVAVATADLATAAWANPAMLTNQRPDDDFSLLIGLGAMLRDNDDLITDIDDYQDADAQRTAAKASGDLLGEAAALVQMSSIVQRIDGKVIAPEVSLVTAMGIAFDEFAMAISVRGDVIAGGTVTNLACDLLRDPTCTPARFESEVNSSSFNTLNLEGVLATEFGVSLAKDFNVADRRLSIGIKPKLVDLQSYTFTESIRTVEAGLKSIEDDQNRSDLGTFTTVDLGAAIDLTDSIRLGLNVRNLLTDQFKIGINTLNFDTEARLGIAYHSSFFTLAVDYDLTENQPLLANPVFDGLKTQYLAVGAEFNAFDYMQLRVGAAKNTSSGISGAAQDTALTAGLGFWLGFNLDIAATYTENSVGAFVQTGFRF